MCEQAGTIMVSGIENDSITDGPGLRFTLFVQGCPFRCDGCHNPQTQPFEGGTPYTAEQLFEKVNKNPLLTGVTLSGGDPFAQAGALAPFARLVKEAGLEVAAYTGYLMEDLLSSPDEGVGQLLQCLDTVVDGPFMKGEKSLDIGFRGSKNQRFIDVPATLKAGRVVEDQTGRWEGR